MGRMLSWVEHLLEESRREIESRRPERAIRLLECLVRVIDSATPAAASVYERLGEAYLMLGDFRRARRCLRRAIRAASDSNKPYLLMARAIAHDPTVDGQRAGQYYRRALKQSPDDPRRFCEAGMYFVDLGRWKFGIACLQRAVDLAPEDLGVLSALVHALCQIERFEDARRAVRVSRFRHRATSRLDQLSDAIEFSQSHSRQRQRGRNEHRRPLLPFLRLQRDADEMSVRQRRWRRDQAAAKSPHFNPHRFSWDHGRSG
ncbi:MAG: tetratricopeptide repeat protein [Gemmataceae bacterium]|nr:tetratricopeptide repeat protein [Gemmataceae bacterium]